MKIACFSDMHGMHRELEYPKADIAICAGDFTARGSYNQIIEFADFFETLEYDHKILIAGNHDVVLESEYNAILREEFKKRGIIYLEDTSVEVMGYKIHGSPIQPNFCNWAFNRARGEQINKHWMMIPNDVDILVTHGPMYGMRDQCPHWGAGLVSVGCEMLQKRIAQLKDNNLRLHIFGHIHEGYGTSRVDKMQFINASVCDARYDPINPIQVVEII